MVPYILGMDVLPVPMVTLKWMAFVYSVHTYTYFKFYLDSRVGQSTPQVRLKMNDKKPSKFQIYFSGVLEAFSILKKF